MPVVAINVDESDIGAGPRHDNAEVVDLAPGRDHTVAECLGKLTDQCVRVPGLVCQEDPKMLWFSLVHRVFAPPLRSCLETAQDAPTTRVCANRSPASQALW